MPKRAKSSSEVHALISAELPTDPHRQTGFVDERRSQKAESRENGRGRSKPKKGRRVSRKASIIPEGPQAGGHTKNEIVSLVCGDLCDGLLPGEISEHLKKERGVTLNREKVYKLVAYAARQGMLQFQPEHSLRLREMMKKRYAWLHDLSVVQTMSADDIARATASEVLVLIKRRAAELAARGEKQVVTVGLAGGASMRELARALANLLCEPSPDLPEEVRLHALVAGFDPSDPVTDPNSFFAFFLRAGLAVDVTFEGFNGPAIADARAVTGMKSIGSIRKAQAAARKLHIVVTSGSQWSKEHPEDHSILYKSLRAAPAVLAELGKLRCVGDIMWHPINANGPVKLTEGLPEVFMALPLARLPRLIADGGHVLLMMGPCAGCGQTKDRLLKTFLDLKQRYVSHLVVDSTTAARVCNALEDA